MALATLAVAAGHRTSTSEGEADQRAAAAETGLRLPPFPRPTPSRIGRGTGRESPAIGAAGAFGNREVEIATDRGEVVVAPAVGPSSAPTHWPGQATAGAGAPSPACHVLALAPEVMPIMGWSMPSVGLFRNPRWDGPRPTAAHTIVRLVVPVQVLAVPARARRASVDPPRRSPPSATRRITSGIAAGGPMARIAASAGEISHGKAGM